MPKGLQIFTNSLLLTFRELRVNKLRTALSLTGIAFGIFCIIGVLAAVTAVAPTSLSGKCVPAL